MGASGVSGRPAWLARTASRMGVFPVLVCAVLALGALSVVASEQILPVSVQVAPLLAGGLLLDRRQMRLLLALVAAVILADLAILGLNPVRASSVALLLLVSVLGYELARRRDRLGVTGLRADDMLLELRDRLRGQGQVPPLPSGWSAEVALRSAGGVGFAGDFLVCSLTPDLSGRPQLLELALVDVSGKGLDAGTRALLLSGALGGLLGALEAPRFLPAANAYLVRQNWDEGFATAVHVVLDLPSGRCEVESAGHPPAVHYDAGSGRWRALPSTGPLLGVLDDVAYEPDRALLRRGDALLLYTDGVIEIPGQDLSRGIDRLLGAAERLIPGGSFAGGADRLLDEVARDTADDRALVLLWRT